MNRKFWFGKYKGETIISVCRRNKSYICWCLLNVKGFNLTPLEELAYQEVEDAPIGSIYNEFNREMTYDMMMNFY